MAWVQVRYSQGLTLLFNSDCKVASFCDALRDRCGYTDLSEAIDLLNADGGLAGLGAVAEGEATSRRASELLKGRGVYTLCKLVVAEDGSTEAESLWEEPEPEHPDHEAEDQG
uniref:Uncharacterized protein n=1 Tax=Emiliania huxleyi TaxID=2903 RepID=A0A7S3W2G9_EMIHU